MVRTIRIGDYVGFRMFSGAIRYGDVVDQRLRGEGRRPTRRDEIHVRTKPDGVVVMVQRWRIVERYALSKPAPNAADPPKRKKS